MNIKPGFPYVITPRLVKKYAAHYHVSEKCLIIPTKIFGSEAACDLRWEGDNGEWQLLQNKFVACENLEPLNPMLESELYATWKKHYDSGSTSSELKTIHEKQTTF
jgi:hypothetical protein